MTTNYRPRGPHTFSPSEAEEGACGLCLLGALAHAGTEDNCDECGYQVPVHGECASCLDEHESLVHDRCCPRALRHDRGYSRPATRASGQ